MLITGELRRRPARRDFAAENRALSILAQELAADPDGVLSRLTELIAQLCQAGSAGISLLEAGPPAVFRWTALVGELAQSLRGGSIPLDASPCGLVVKRNEILLFRDADLHFPLLRAATPAVHESLLCPFDVDGRPAGTVWAMKHRPAERFNAEDARLLKSLSGFAGLAYQATRARARAERARDAAVTLHPRLLQVSKLAMIGEIASGIANELSQPLTAIGNYAQACKRLLSRPQIEPETLCAAVEAIDTQAHRAAEAIVGLRRLAAAPAADAPESDLNQAVEEALEVLLIDARLRKVHIEARLAADLAPVQIAPAQIQHVLLNLVRNALEVLEGAPSQRQVVLETRRTAEGAELTISDNGPGLPEDVRQRMFQPFFSTKAGGTGLGLAVSHSIVRAHGGRLSYEPHAAGGASFKILLPAAPGS